VAAIEEGGRAEPRQSAAALAVRRASRNSVASPQFCNRLQRPPCR
jgi:hypothetical protein